MAEQTKQSGTGTSSTSRQGQNVPQSQTGVFQADDGEQQKADDEATLTGEQKRQAYLDDLERIRNEP